MKRYFAGLISIWLIFREPERDYVGILLLKSRMRLDNPEGINEHTKCPKKLLYLVEEELYNAKESGAEHMQAGRFSEAEQDIQRARQLYQLNMGLQNLVENSFVYVK